MTLQRNQEVKGMYVRMVWGKLRPGAWGEYERHYHERVAGAGNVTGLRERQLLRSTEDPDEGISVSVWNTLEDLRNYETSEFRQTMAREVEHLYRGEYWVKHFEISANDH
jgi:heme-degrading monooxygenase HmoA